MKKEGTESIKSNIFARTKKRLVIINMAVVIFSMLIFSAIIVLFYSLTLFSKVDSEINNQIIMTEQFLYDTNNNLNRLPGDLNGVVNGRRPKLRLDSTPIRNPKFIIFIYDEEQLIFKTTDIFYLNDEKPNVPNVYDKIFNFKDKGYNFRGKTFIYESFKVQIMVNTDSEVDALYRLFQVVSVCLGMLLATSYLLAKYLTSKALKPIKKSYDEQVYFIQDASHEMRTPLSIIKGKAELLAVHPNDTIESHIEDISFIMSEIRAMEKLNRDLLMLSKEDVDTSVDAKKLDLLALANEIEEFFEMVSTIQDKHFTIIKPNQWEFVNWDYAKIKQALTILLDNAFKYTEAGDSIYLTFKTSEKDVVITVEDTGYGIKEIDKNRIFDRFFRSDDIRGKNIDGSGIGLSILKSLSRVHKFNIKVQSTESIGTKFILTIPKIIKFY